MRHLAAALPLLFSTACMVGGSDRTWDLPADLRGVDLRIGNGSLTVLPGDADRVIIEWSGGGIGGGNLFPEPEVVDDVAWFDARCGAACGGDVTVWLPRAMDVSAQANAGDVEVHLADRADVRACTAMGSVLVEVPAGRWDLSLDVSVGDLTVDGVSHDPLSEDRIEACAALGDLEVIGR